MIKEYDDKTHAEPMTFEEQIKFFQFFEKIVVAKCMLEAAGLYTMFSYIHDDCNNFDPPEVNTCEWFLTGRAWNGPRYTHQPEIDINPWFFGGADIAVSIHSYLEPREEKEYTDADEFLKDLPGIIEEYKKIVKEGEPWVL